MSPRSASSAQRTPHPSQAKAHVCGALLHGGYEAASAEKGTTLLKYLSARAASVLLSDDYQLIRRCKRLQCSAFSHSERIYD
eukprot:3225104-Prymnesium_polylepis.1